MARYSIKAVDLAKEMGISTNSVSNLRKGNTMPRLDGDSLNSLCNALNKLALDLDEEITPVTLIQYSRDFEPVDESKVLKTEISTKRGQKEIGSSLKKDSQTRSLLPILPQSQSA
ncbi:XRE family transcriptional regulator [Aphanothece hegewaldii CCALA 016]|uniref:XRE family transcriptional regulator n=2 Tax=Aphanothece TaxID=1121 RepID=A0A2T1LQM3_9CHRO|nr:XRE family transcriptional regulator [Aphanothece hegewaldii CCALA 016]